MQYQRITSNPYAGRRESERQSQAEKITQAYLRNIYSRTKAGELSTNMNKKYAASTRMGVGSGK